LCGKIIDRPVIRMPAGVINETIDPGKFAESGGNKGGEIGGVGDVAGKVKSAVVDGFGVEIGGGFLTGGFVGVRDNDVGAGVVEWGHLKRLG